MSNPILRIVHTIQLRALYVYVLIAAIEVDIPDRRGFIRLRVSKADGGEERRGDEIDVLTWVREQAKDREDGEASHGAGVVVAGEAGGGGVEMGWDI